MKILTPRNNKDYYDYLNGIIGIDEKLVYDRRQYTVLGRLKSAYFCQDKLEDDAPKKEIQTFEWTNRRCTKVLKYEGKILNCMLEVGLKWYFFSVERYLDENDIVHIDWKLIKTKEVTKQQRLGETPITFFKAYASYRWWDDKQLDVRVEKEDAIQNPILINTPIASLISAQEIYDLLYSYISSLNDIEVIDNRTDGQKIESAGFDSKTSFRNMK